MIKLPLVLKATVFVKVVVIALFEWTSKLGEIPQLGYSLEAYKNKCISIISRSFY